MPSSETSLEAFFQKNVKIRLDRGIPVKMPEEPIAPGMFAPCGMNCKVCYKHCYHRKPCVGCMENSQGKPEHCRKCKIKDCLKEKRLAYCYECGEFPCARIRNLEKSYNKRYNASLVENSRFVRQEGLSAFLERQKEKYTCPVCGGIISIHDFECSECQWKAP